MNRSRLLKSIALTKLAECPAGEPFCYRQVIQSKLFLYLSTKKQNKNICMHSHTYFFLVYQASPASTSVL